VCSEDFREFFRREISPLVTFVNRAGFGWHQACDAAQDAMVKAYVEWPGLTQPRAWVRTTAYRIAKAEAVRSKDGVLRAVAGGWSVSTHIDPDVAILGYEHEQLLKLLGSLPPRQQPILAWTLDGFTTIEISEQLSMSPYHRTIPPPPRAGRSESHPPHAHDRRGGLMDYNITTHGQAHDDEFDLWLKQANDYLVGLTRQALDIEAMLTSVQRKGEINRRVQRRRQTEDTAVSTCTAVGTVQGSLALKFPSGSASASTAGGKALKPSLSLVPPLQEKPSLPMRCSWL
jgi:DNA-directed RNA polymerase specialized sigma24 family protein